MRMKMMALAIFEYFNPHRTFHDLSGVFSKWAHSSMSQTLHTHKVRSARIKHIDQFIVVILRFRFSIVQSFECVCLRWQMTSRRRCIHVVLCLPSKHTICPVFRANVLLLVRVAVTCTRCTCTCDRILLIKIGIFEKSSSSLWRTVADGIGIRMYWMGNDSVGRCEKRLVGVTCKMFGCLFTFSLPNKVRLSRIGSRRAISLFFVSPIHSFVHWIDAIERKIAFFLPGSLSPPHSFVRILLTDKHLLRSQFSPFK